MSNYYTKNIVPTPKRITLALGEKESGRHAIIPLFLPFAGCPHRCIFCAQDKQTGQSAGMLPLSLSEALAKLFSRLEARKAEKDDRELELGFYGGTFTLLPEADQAACLRMGTACKDLGYVRRVRCSTRPDALERAWLTRLKARGLDLVEAGVQSFSDAALAASRRGYRGKDAEAGCLAVHAAGLELGIQLLPGMPGSTPDTFLEDVHRALALRPACLRFYPCLVIDQTPLASLWRRGGYTPWDRDTTVRALGRGLAAAWKAGVPVIRLSLAPEAALDAAVLAGPRHPALGNMAQGEALLLTVAEQIRALGRSHARLCLPKRCQGFFFGHKGELRPRWLALGIDPENVIWTKEEAAIIGKESM